MARWQRAGSPIAAAEAADAEVGVAAGEARHGIGQLRDCP